MMTLLMLPSMEKGLETTNVAIYKVWGICRNWAKRNQVNYLELMVLRLLRHTEACTQREIRKTYALPKQTVNNAIKTLSRSGYLTISTAKWDKRQRILQITEAGASYADEKLALLLQVEEAMLNRMGKDDFALMSQLIQDYIRIMEIEMSGPEHFGEY